MFKFLNRKSRGFTLIELLVVIAIIGILASIVMVSMSGARAKARDAVRKSDIRQIGAAMELYYSDNEAYFQSATTPTAIGTYMSTVPKDPGSGNPAYGWVSNASGSTDSCTPGAQNQCFCVYATIEGGGFFAASQKGTKDGLAAAPTTQDCW